MFGQTVLMCLVFWRLTRERQKGEPSKMEVNPIDERVVSATSLSLSSFTGTTVHKCIHLTFDLFQLCTDVRVQCSPIDTDTTRKHKQHTQTGCQQCDVTRVCHLHR